MDWIFDVWLLYFMGNFFSAPVLFAVLHDSCILISTLIFRLGNYHVFFCLKYFLFLSPVFLFPLFTRVLFTGFVFSRILCFLRCLGSRFFQTLHFVWLFSVYVPFWKKHSNDCKLNLDLHIHIILFTYPVIFYIFKIFLAVSICLVIVLKTSAVGEIPTYFLDFNLADLVVVSLNKSS